MSSVLTVRDWRYLLVALIMSLTATSMMSQVSWAQEEEAVVTEEVVAEEETPAEEAAEAEEAETEAPTDLGIGYALDNIMLCVCACLVFFMQAGFALVETGFNASKNAINILFKNTMDFCIGSILFYFVGFGLMYPGSYGVDVTEHPYFAFGGTGLYEASSPREFSPSTDWFFQCMFAATAATIVSGAVAGRIKIGAYFVYSAFICAIVYPISGFWKWGGGWLTQLPDGQIFQDFAGSAVVHTVGGFAGLAGAMLLGPRIGKFVGGKAVPMPGHSLPLACLGVFILWLGWFGFNPGSQLGFQATAEIDIVMHVAITTTLAAAAGGVAGTFGSWLLFGKPDLGMALNGILGGLVGITAGCDCFTVEMSILIGVVAAFIVMGGCVLLDKLHIDDPVGAFPVHGLCGIWGVMAIGILPNVYTTAAVAEKLRGTAAADFVAVTSFKTQLIGALAYAGWAFATMFILFGILKAIGFLRANEHEETKGLDISEHGMQAYQA
ncbi:MAG: ammonium transporter [Bythopirellula sp.]|nr:ammonium transporter [Bythopirellula sp.]